MTRKIFVIIIIILIGFHDYKLTIRGSFKPQTMPLNTDTTRCATIAPGVAVVGSYNFNTGRFTVSLPDPKTGENVTFTGTPEAIAYELGKLSSSWRNNALSGVAVPDLPCAEFSNDPDHPNFISRSALDRDEFGPYNFGRLDVNANGGGLSYGFSAWGIRNHRKGRMERFDGTD